MNASRPKPSASSRLGRPSMRGWLLIFAAFALACLTLTSCSSTADVAKVKSAETVAVPIITVDQNIDLSDVQDGAGTLVQRLLDDDAFDLSPMVGELHTKVYQTYAKRLPGDVLPEDQVIRTERYQNFQLLDRSSSDDRMQNLSSILVPEGYKKYNVATGSVFGSRQKKMFGAVPDQADALLFVSANYAMKKDNPFWYWFVPFTPDQAAVKATVSMEMIDRSGEVILDVQRSATSADRMTMVGGLNLNPDEIQKLCFDATEKAFQEVDTFTKQELAANSGS